MFHRDIILPAPFERIELFSLAEPVPAPYGGKPQMVRSLYMAQPYAEGGKLLLRRCPWFNITTPLYVEGE